MVCLNIIPMTRTSSIPDDMSEDLSKAVDDINISNKSVFDIIPDGLDNEELKLRVSSSIDDLSSTKQSLSHASCSDKYTSLKSSISSGLDYNILFYKQLLGILNSLTSTDVYESEKNLQKYDDMACKLYSKASPLKVYYFENDNRALAFLYNSLNKLSLNNRDAKLSREKNNNFLMALDSIYTDFKKCHINFTPYLEKYNSKSYNYDKLMEDINADQSSLDSLIQRIYALAIPSDGYNVYENLKDVLNCYRSYLNTIQLDLSKSAISNDSSSLENSNSKKEDVDYSIKQYEDSLSEYKSMLDSKK